MAKPTKSVKKATAVVAPQPEKVKVVAPSKMQQQLTATSVLSAPPESVVARAPEDIRSSLKSIYALANQLQGSGFTYQARNIEVDKQKHVSTEQIWGQLNVLLAPILTHARDNLDVFSSKATTENDDVAAKQTSVKKQAPSTTDAVEDDIFEDVEDEEFDLHPRSKKTKKASKKDADAKEDWRYAFGRTNENEEDEELEEGDDAVDDMETNSERRMRLRNAMAEDAVDEEEEDEEGDDEENAEDELAAMKELYGEDFDDSDARLGDLDEEDEEGADEENFEGSDQGEEATGDIIDYRGDDDILDDRDHPDHHGEGDEEELDEELNNPDLTELERQTLRERRHIERMEKERLYGGKWSMTGEVSGAKRPKDSLLEEALDFEHAMKAVPVITEHTTVKLEERIKQRILNKTFDDVQRRSTRSAADDLVSTKRDATVDSEKSKMSLMDLYEKDYLEKMKLAEGPNAAAHAEPLTEIEKDELRAIQMWKRLSQHLDALSNFFFTPKPVQQDLDARVRAVENQAPAIVMESVGNLAASREAALAPQDVFRMSRQAKAGISVDEMDPKEKRALRRAKKESFAATKERKEKKTEIFKKNAEEKKAIAEAAVAAKKGGRKGK